MKKIFTYVLIYLLIFCSCKGQDNNNDKRNMKIRSKTSLISPDIVSKLEATEEFGVVKLSFTNTTGKELIIDKNNFGGENFRIEGYYLKGYPYIAKHHALEFNNEETKNIPPDYITLKPGENFSIITDLKKFYDFKKIKKTPSIRISSL